MVCIKNIMFYQNTQQTIISGESGIAYFYTRVRFNWNELDYSLFSTFLFMTNIVGKDRYSNLKDTIHL